MQSVSAESTATQGSPNALYQTLADELRSAISDGRLPATVEVVYGHAWKAAPKVAEDGRAIVRFERKPG